jgi:galactarate dehydratase
MPVAQELRPLCIQVHPQDNVAIIVNPGGLRAGARFDSGLVLVEDVPEAHKVALVDIAEGQPVLRYGVPIGTASELIAKGSWVHESRMWSLR